MVEYSTIFSAVLPVFLLIGLGWLMRSRNWFSASGEKEVMRLVVNVLYPCLIFSFVHDNDLLRDPALVVEAVTTGFLFITLGALVVALAAPLFGIREKRDRGTFAFVTAVYNYGYIAIPVARLFFSDEVIGVLLVVNVGVELAIWSVGIMVVSGQFNWRSLRRAFSPPVLAVFVGLPINYYGWYAEIPSALMALVNMLAVCAIPIGIFIIGVAFCDLAHGQGAKLRPGVAIGAVAMRLLVLPALMLLSAWVLPFSDAMREVIIIHAAMPCGVFPVVIAKHYGGSGHLAFQAVAASSLVGFLTIPLWVQAGFKLLH